MPSTVVLGAQWGDEGKGKLVDILSQESTLCCRAAGGNNAGHTIVANGITYDFHILPSGLINPDCKNLIGAGCVVHVPSFFAELEALRVKGLDGVKERIFISDRAHVCFDMQVAVDGIVEDASGRIDGGRGKIGTTRKGIGPCYADKVARRGVPMNMLFSGKWESRLRDLERGYRKLYGDDALEGYDLEDEIKRFKEYIPMLAPYIVSQVPLLSSASVPSSPHNILIEGANALLLDIDHGTYPFVTSSNTGLGGIMTGLAGLRPQSLLSGTIAGVVKAYTTRVGSGPFPTELDPDAANPVADAKYGEMMQRIGREFGVTTGRKRRCGWLDLVLVKYSTFINGYTAINLTKLDILDTFDEIRVAVGYTIDGEPLDTFPSDLDQLAQVEVEYKTFPGWQTSTTGAKTWSDLPEQAQTYINFIEQEVGVPIKWIGTGPKREDMVSR